MMRVEFLENKARKTDGY